MRCSPNCRPDQPGRIEAPIVIDPSSHYRIDKSCEFLKLHITVEMKTPSLDLVAYLLGDGVTDRRREADDELTSCDSWLAGDRSGTGVMNPMLSTSSMREPTMIDTGSVF